MVPAWELVPVNLLTHLSDTVKLLTVLYFYHSIPWHISLGIYGYISFGIYTSVTLQTRISTSGETFAQLTQYKETMI